MAATEFYQDGLYVSSARGHHDDCEMVAYYEGLIAEYPILSIEDGLSEDDWEGWKLLTERLGERVQLVGDDLFVTNVERLRRGIDEDIANSILVKVNQIGTVTETLETDRDGALRPASPPSCRTVRAKPRTRPSPTWRSGPTSARSRPGRPLERAGRKVQPASAHRGGAGPAAVYAGRAPFAALE